MGTLMTNGLLRIAYVIEGTALQVLVHGVEREVARANRV
jgi:hypothetical protein